MKRKKEKPHYVYSNALLCYNKNTFFNQRNWNKSLKPFFGGQCTISGFFVYKRQSSFNFFRDYTSDS